MSPDEFKAKYGFPHWKVTKYNSSKEEIEDAQKIAKSFDKFAWPFAIIFTIIGGVIGYFQFLGESQTESIINGMVGGILIGAVVGIAMKSLRMKSKK